MLIPDPPPNSIIMRIPQLDKWLNSNDRMHWAQRNRITRTWRDGGHAFARSKRLPKLQRAEIRVFVHKATARRYDAMNLYPTFKAVVDGFVDYGMLPDDDNAHLIGPMIFAGSMSPKTGATIYITSREAAN